MSWFIVHINGQRHAFEATSAPEAADLAISVGLVNKHQCPAIRPINQRNLDKMRGKLKGVWPRNVSSAKAKMLTQKAHDEFVHESANDGLEMPDWLIDRAPWALRVPHLNPQIQEVWFAMPDYYTALEMAQKWRDALAKSQTIRKFQFERTLVLSGVFAFPFMGDPQRHQDRVKRDYEFALKYIEMLRNDWRAA